MTERAKRIRELIEKSGKSYVELEKLTGIKKSSLQRYATGQTTKIPLDAIEALAQAFHVPSAYLMGWEEEPTEEEDESWRARQDAFDRTEMRVLFDAAKDVPASKIYEVVAMLEKFKEDSR